MCRSFGVLGPQYRFRSEKCDGDHFGKGRDPLHINIPPKTKDTRKLNGCVRRDFHLTEPPQLSPHCCRRTGVNPQLDLLGLGLPDVVTHHPRSDHGKTRVVEPSFLLSPGRPLRPPGRNGTYTSPSPRSEKDPLSLASGGFPVVNLDGRPYGLRT